MRSVRLLTAGLALTCVALTAAPSQAGAPAPVLVDTSLAGWQPAEVAPGLGNITIVSIPRTSGAQRQASFVLQNATDQEQTYEVTSLTPTVTGFTVTRQLGGSSTIVARRGQDLFTIAFNRSSVATPTQFQVSRVGGPSAIVNVVDYATP